MKALRGDRCRCPACREVFNSTYAFDKHRVGPFPSGRRCISPAEMAAKGMAKNAAGFWISAVKADPSAPWMRSGGDRPDPSPTSHPRDFPAGGGADPDHPNGAQRRP